MRTPLNSPSGIPATRGVPAGAPHAYSIVEPARRASDPELIVRLHEPGATDWRAYASELLS